ncbi:MAG: hypothetical protein HOW73_25240 [Polyangiaceae bacterium]|nr:hypothetical protein [Polyangiaceae bacterium]
MLGKPVTILTLAASTLVACGDDSSVGGGGEAGAVNGGGGAGGAVDGGGGTGGMGGGVEHGDCEGIAPGTVEPRSLVVGLSRAHASNRFFGLHDDVNVVDRALVSGLRESLDDETSILTKYVEELGDGCAMPAATSEPEAAVTVTGDVAWITPGTEDVAPPDQVTTVIVDLRDFVETPDAEARLATLAASLLDAPVAPLDASLRMHEGMRDEFYAPIVLGTENVYDDRVDEVALASYEANAATSYRIGVVVGDRVAPSAARFALTLRAAGRAAILGSDMRTSVAESRWISVGELGYVHRFATLEHDGDALPDVVPADVKGDDDAALASGLAALGELSALSGPAERPKINRIQNTTDVPVSEFDRPSRIAALVTAHGAMKSFFAYWAVVPDQSDTRLEEAVAMAMAAEQEDFPALHRELGYLSHALHDSHGFIFHLSEWAGYTNAPVVLEQSSTMEPVVRASTVLDFLPGDTIVEVDGVPAADLMAERSEFVASSESSAFRNAARTLLEIRESATFLLRDADGAEREVELSEASVPVAYPDYPARLQSTLGDLGHPELYYVNLDSSKLTSGALNEALAGIDASEGVVLDMRGYPSSPAWTLIQHMLVQSAPGVPMRTPIVTALGLTWEDAPQPFPASATAFAGKVAMLVGTHTQSQAEHLTLVLQSAERVQVIGQPTAGANGNITGVLLPGGASLTFTGLEVRRPDLSPFHGMGVAIDELVPIEPSDLADGVDPELQSAIEWLIAP